MKISDGARKLYDILQPESWMTERNLAKVVGCRAASIKNYKEELESVGLIAIVLRRNGKRGNPKHEIIKFPKEKRSPICKHILQSFCFNAWGSFGRNELIECYLKSGWDILPFEPRSKRLQRGFTKKEWGRLSVEEKIDYFYDKPNLNPGLAICSHLMVVDVETKSNFWIQNENFQNTLTVSTPRGFHFYFRNDSAITTSTKIIPDIDTRCSSSFVLLPPSVHPTGELYMWERISKPAILPIEFRRQWRQLNFQKNTNDEIFSVPATIEQGTRNDTLWRCGRSLRAKGKNSYEIEAELKKYNRLRCSPPLSEKEVQNLIENVWSRSDRPSFRQAKIT